MEATNIKIHFGEELDSSRTGKASRKGSTSINEGHLVFNLPHISVEFPFHRLEIKNQAELVRVGKYFLEDIEAGKNQFGFKSLVKTGCEKSVLAYGSYINYMMKKPVLFVVKDLTDKCWDPYRVHFTRGTLWKWNCSDWGELCFIDFKQINIQGDSFNRIAFKEITNEFCSVVWSLPEEDLNHLVPKNSLKILSEIDSVTLIIGKVNTLSQEVKKAVSYYQCFEIPLKGILTEEEEK